MSFHQRPRFPPLANPALGVGQKGDGALDQTGVILGETGMNTVPDGKPLGTVGVRHDRTERPIHPGLAAQRPLRLVALVDEPWRANPAARELGGTPQLGDARRCQPHVGIDEQTAVGVERRADSGVEPRRGAGVPAGRNHHRVDSGLACDLRRRVLRGFGDVWVRDESSRSAVGPREQSDGQADRGAS